MHRLSSHRAAGLTQSGLAAAPLPYLAVFIYLLIIYIDLFIDRDLSDYFDLSGPPRGESPLKLAASSPQSQAVSRSRTLRPAAVALRVVVHIHRGAGRRY